MSRGRSPATLSFSILSFSATYLSHRNHFECNLAQLLPHDGSSKWLYSRLQTSVLGILTVRVSCLTLSFLPVGSYVMVLSRREGPLVPMILLISHSQQLLPKTYARYTMCISSPPATTRPAEVRLRVLHAPKGVRCEFSDFTVSGGGG